MNMHHCSHDIMRVLAINTADLLILLPPPRRENPEVNICQNLENIKTPTEKLRAQRDLFLLGFESFCRGDPC